MDVMGMVASIAEQSARAIQMEDGDYEQDGLLYCGKCHTPKQTTVELGGETLTVNCLCKCREKQLADEEEQAKREKASRERARTRREGIQDERLSRMTFSNDDQANRKMSTIAHRYVDKFDEMLTNGKGLLLYGTVGTGKTFYATCIANALMDKGVPCMVTNFTRIVNTLYAKEDKQEYLDELNRYDLLVIDDLAAERNTEYMVETVQMVIDARYLAGKPLIVTTNLTTEELNAPADMAKQRLYSRLLGMCYPIELKGADRRRKVMRNARTEMEELLGI